jgi:hypothetical protein
VLHAAFVCHFIDCLAFVASDLTNPVVSSPQAMSITRMLGMHVAVELFVTLLAYQPPCDEIYNNHLMVQQPREAVRKGTHLCLTSRFLYV